jgi:hypothetical protein
MRLFGAARRSRLLNTSGSSWEALRDLAHERVPLPLGAKEFRKETARVSSERRLTGGLPPFHDVRGTSLSQPCAVSCRRANHFRVESGPTLFGEPFSVTAPADRFDLQDVASEFLAGHADEEVPREPLHRNATATVRDALRSFEGGSSGICCWRSSEQ